MKITKYRLRLRYAYLKATVITIFCCLFFLKGYITFEKTGDNLFHIAVNGTEVGSVTDVAEAEDLIMEARKEIASQSEDLVFMDIQLSYTGEERLWGRVDDKDQVYENILTVLEDNVIETMQRSYTVKVNEYMVNLSSEEEVISLLQAAVDNFDTEGKFGIVLEQDHEREFRVLDAEVVDRELQAALEEEAAATEAFPTAGIQAELNQFFAQEVPEEEMDFEDYDLGIKTMGFSETIEIVEAYLPSHQLKSLEQAVDELTKEQELQQIYQVVSGDTLTEIAIKVNIPMETIVEMNDSLESVNSTLHIGQELIITVPEPELSVERKEVNYYEEIYDAEVVYIDNDNWYTNQSVVLQQPSAGFRKVVVEETYLNDKQIDREILKEEVVLEAVAKVVERGTKTPPTYIKPLSGGRLSSKFGARNAPTAGASTYHKGVDWATPTGTSVVASCGGTVAKAGWGSGYGYVVYINHEDGRQTRYAHLSKVLVKAGQTVKQGQQIALSGNTGITSGPHVHFEILVNGKQVDPLTIIK